jgi:hypothetical protein
MKLVVTSPQPHNRCNSTTVSAVKDDAMRQVKLSADPRLAWAFVLLPGSIVVTAWAWGGLGWHARGMLLAAWGVAVALVLLVPALRTRARLKAGVSAQGTVVGAEKRISSTGIGTWAPTFMPVTLYHRRVRFATRDGRTVVFTSALGAPTASLSWATLCQSATLLTIPSKPRWTLLGPGWCREYWDSSVGWAAGGRSRGVLAGVASR